VAAAEVARQLARAADRAGEGQGAVAAVDRPAVGAQDDPAGVGHGGVLLVELPAVEGQVPVGVRPVVAAEGAAGADVDVRLGDGARGDHAAEEGPVGDGERPDGPDGQGVVQVQGAPVDLDVAGVAAVFAVEAGGIRLDGDLGIAALAGDVAAEVVVGRPRVNDHPAVLDQDRVPQCPGLVGGAAAVEDEEGVVGEVDVRPGAGVVEVQPAVFRKDACLRAGDAGPGLGAAEDELGGAGARVAHGDRPRAEGLVVPGLQAAVADVPDPAEAAVVTRQDRGIIVIPDLAGDRAVARRAGDGPADGPRLVPPGVHGRHAAGDDHGPGPVNGLVAALVHGPAAGQVQCRGGGGRNRAIEVQLAAAPDGDRHQLRVEVGGRRHGDLGRVDQGRVVRGGIVADALAPRVRGVGDPVAVGPVVVARRPDLPGHHQRAHQQCQSRSLPCHLKPPQLIRPFLMVRAPTCRARRKKRAG